LLGLVPAEDVQVNRMLLFFAARRFLECVGLAHPTLLVFEDVHWAQASEMELLEHLAQRLRDAPLVLIALTRQELLDSRPTWGGGLVPQTTILLEPLSADEAAELATGIVDEFPGRTLDLDRLVEVSGGNPLFLEELDASVLELGDAGALPVTVREAISARIDALPAEARAALLSAAVVGRTFWRSILDAVSNIPDLDEALSMLEVRGLVRHDHTGQISGDAQFTFKHMLIREVAYATVPRAARRELHAKVARAIEGAVEDSAETFRSILAYHWSEGGERGRAIPYLLAAAQAARRSWAQSAVVDLYSRALELAEDEDLKRRIRLERGLALVEIQEYERAAEELAELLPELAGPERLDALISRGHATLWTERDEETLAIAQEALESGRSVFELVREKQRIDDAELERLLAPETMTDPRTG
jgi:predicted ATPase